MRSSPVTAIGYQWQADARSQSLLSSAVSLTVAGAVPCPTVWRSLDNVDVTVNLDSIKTIAAAMAYATQVAYHHSWDLKQQIMDEQTPEEVAALLKRRNSKGDSMKFSHLFT